MNPPEIAERPRTERMLRSALGPLLLARLEDPDVSDLMVNPDGRVWLDRFDTGLVDAELMVSPADAERIIRLIAHHVGAEVHAGSPRLSAELPGTGERFEAQAPPVVTSPVFAIRKPARQIFTLDDWIRAGVLSPAQARVLWRSVRDRRNILIAGQTGSGKTTLANMLLEKVAETGDRVILCEDLRELRCAAPNLVALRTVEGLVTLTDLVRSTLRLRPDRIIIGEVRGPEALDLVKAWGTGHPGGIATIHAGSALGALLRLEQLIQEAVVTAPRALIADTIDLIVVLAGRGRQRRLIELSRLEGVAPSGDYQLGSA